MSNTADYAIRSKNATPVTILRSWLRAQGIPVTTSSVPGFDLTIPGRLGGTIEIVVNMERDAAVPGAGVMALETDAEPVEVYGPDITGKHPATALEAYYRVLRVAGYDCVPPVNRGPELQTNAKGNPRKLHYRDEPFLVSIRHTEFRRAPDPTPEQWERYAEVMEKATWNCLRFPASKEVIDRNGEDFQSLLTLARCWVVNFCSRYEIPEEDVVWNDNERKCYSFLVQRFREYITILRKKERSTHPDMETVNIGLFSRPDADTEVSPDPEDEGVVDFDYVRAHCQLDVSTPNRRRASADKILSNLLQQMQHDDMVTTLKQASVLDRFDYDTRQEAARRLKLHRAECDACQASEEVGAQEDEEAPGLDDAGAVE